MSPVIQKYSFLPLHMSQWFIYIFTIKRVSSICNSEVIS